MESVIEATYISHISTTKTAFISINHNMSSQQLWIKSWKFLCL